MQIDALGQENKITLISILIHGVMWIPESSEYCQLSIFSLDRDGPLEVKLKFGNHAFLDFWCHFMQETYLLLKMLLKTSLSLILSPELWIFWISLLDQNLISMKSYLVILASVALALCSGQFSQISTILLPDPVSGIKNATKPCRIHNSWPTATTYTFWNSQMMEQHFKTIFF